MTAPPEPRIRPLTDGDLPSCAALLRAVHRADGYRAVWPGRSDRLAGSAPRRRRRRRRRALRAAGLAPGGLAAGHAEFRRATVIHIYLAPPDDPAGSSERARSHDSPAKAGRMSPPAESEVA